MLYTKVGILSPGEIQVDDTALKFRAIWDTGASITSISEKIANTLSLKPSGKIDMQAAHNVASVNTYIVNVALPNRVVVGNIMVACPKGLIDGDVLIGMDIISNGDMAITNFGGNTKLTFSMPPWRDIDFVEQDTPRVGRNDPCHCGSGKKFKKCHGK